MVNFHETKDNGLFYLNKRICFFFSLVNMLLTLDKYFLPVGHFSFLSVTYYSLHI